MGRKRVEAPAALPEPPKGKRDKLEQLAGRMKNWRPAREILRPVQAVPTIFPWLDYATKVNGYPTQRICVVHGPSAEGKTELALGLGLSFLKKRHLFAHVDAEYTTPITWLQELLKGYEDDPLFMALRPKSYEHTVDSVREVLKMMIAGKKSGELAPETSGLIVLDSLRKLVPENFLAKIARFGAQGQKGSVDGMNGMGAAIKAKMNSDWFDELTPMLYEAGAGMLIIGRESENRDAKETGQSWKLTGGRSLLFESSLMMRVERDWVREGAGDDSVIVGERHDVGIYKSKVAGKADDVETFSFFTSNGKVTPEGFDPARDMFELGIALEVVKQAGSWYSFGGKRFQGKSQGVKRLAADVTMRGDLDAAIRREFAKTAVPAEVRP